MIRLRSRFQGQCHALLAGGALALICLALAWAHSAPAPSHMAAEEDHMEEAISMCLAVLSTGLALLAAVGGMFSLRRRRTPIRLAPTVPTSLSRTPAFSPANARASPALLQVFLR
jgi:hypothetical protein